MKARIVSCALLPFVFACGAVASGGNDAAAPFDSAVIDASPDVAVDSAAEASVVPLADMLAPRALFGAVTGSDGLVRAFSGLTNIGLVSSVEAYDATANTWTAGAVGTVARYAHTVAADASGNVYVIGGTSNGMTAIGSVEVYSTTTNAWTTAPDLPTPRLGLGAATAKDGRIFAIGGGLPGAPTNVVEVYSPTTQAWTSGPSMPTARLSLQAVLGPDGLIYAIGGRDANTTPLSVVEVLDPVSGTWTTGPSLSNARYWFAATVAHDGRIFAIGGVGGFGFLDSVEALTIGTGWSTAPSLPENRAWLSAAVTPDGRVLAMGGGTDTGGMNEPPPLATMLAYDPTASAWSQ
jgi:hypothetical protein